MNYTNKHRLRDVSKIMNESKEWQKKTRSYLPNRVEIILI